MKVEAFCQVKHVALSRNEAIPTSSVPLPGVQVAPPPEPPVPPPPPPIPALPVELDELPPVSPPLDELLLVVDVPPAPPVAEDGSLEHPEATNQAVAENRIAVHRIMVAYAYHDRVHQEKRPCRKPRRWRDK
jgi:hypothetical protein